MPLTERHEQTAFLRRKLQEASNGNGRVVVVTGGIAVGKSALMLDFLQDAGPTTVKLAAVASRGERSHTFGVIRQLLHDAPLTADVAERAERLFDEATMTGADPRTRIEQMPAATIYGLCQILLGLTTHGPLVITVDDADHADPASRECLLYVARRLRSAPVLMVLSEPAIQTADGVPFQAELARQPYHCRLRLLPLSPAGTRELLAEHLPPAVADRLAPDAHAVTGGNPMLVRALADDQDPQAQRLTVGAAFREAFVTCLYRHDNELVHVPHALAALGDAAGRSTIGRLAGVDIDTVNRVLDVSACSGLLNDSGAFRHPEARAAVLRYASQQTRTQIYRQAAHILHDEGGGPTEVAQCLLAAAVPPDAWSVPVLREAARLALAAGDPDLAVRHLRLAYQADVDAEELLAIQWQLASTEWQLDPATAGRHLADLTAATAANRLSPRCAAAVVKNLAWHGHVDEAVTTLGHAISHCTEPDPEVVAVLDAAGQYVNYLFPGLAVPRPEALPILGPSGADQAHSAFAMLRSALNNVPADRDATSVEELLHAFRIPASQVPDEAVLAALETLLYTDALDQAEQWSSVIHDEARHRASPAWQAIFAGLRAEVAFRRGDLVSAAKLARDALAQLSLPGWGVAVGGPLSTLILVATAMGEREEAAAALRKPVPAAMMQTPLGVRYLYARGRYHLATNRLQAALVDFRSCGRLMEAWNMDQPALAPWRTDAALTLLHLGQPMQARQLAEEELRRSSEQRTRSRALTLRALGVTGSAQRCTDLLAEAAEILEECGDRLELVYTLTSLGEAYRATADATQARVVLHQANQVASECGAEVVQRRISPCRPRGATRTRATPNEARRLADLSEAERRVALLAAHGLTNREISTRLYITMSTVEQHLTRVYRKLSIKSRNDLPRGLGVDFAYTA
jgi:DNA-binding CsgD family transcriptional regulator